MNHYTWLSLHLNSFFSKIGIVFGEVDGIIVAHGDKADQYKCTWEENDIPFEQGVAVYLASYCAPYSDTVRQTKNGFIAPCDWVLVHHKQWKHLFDGLN